MASTNRIGRALRPAPSLLCRGVRRVAHGHPPLAYCVATTRLRPLPTAIGPATAAFHSTPHRPNDRGERAESDLSKLDVLGNTPVPSNSIDICMSDGFKFNNGATVEDGSGAIVVGGEAFAWRPWLARGGSGGGGGGKGEKRLLNPKGQWDVPEESLSLFDLIWPRPDILILGTGPSIRPISPRLRSYISSLGMRVEVLDTRNAASQFNLLATERGIDNIAAALVPIGWKEGVGAR